MYRSLNFNVQNANSHSKACRKIREAVGLKRKYALDVMMMLHCGAVLFGTEVTNGGVATLGEITLKYPCLL